MIFSKELRSNLGKIIAWLIVITVFVGLLFALYPMMLDVNMKSIFDKFVLSLSPTLKKVIGFDENIEYTNISEYIAFSYQYIVALVVILAMQLGTNALPKEQASGSIQYIYSNPISRAEIVSQKLLASIVSYLIFLILLFLVTLGLLFVIPMDISFDLATLAPDIGKIFVGIFLSGLVYISVGYFFGSISKNNYFSDGTSVLFVLITLVLSIISKVYGAAYSSVTNIFPLEVFKPIRLLNMNIYMLGLATNIAIIIVFILLSYMVYNFKELDY